MNEWKGLQLAAGIVREITVEEPDPYSTGGIRGHPPRHRVVVLLPHGEAFDAHQSPRHSSHGDPDVVRRVFRNAGHHACVAAVGSAYFAKRAAGVRPEGVVETDPEPAGMVFEQRRDLRSRQLAARAHARYSSVLQMAERLITADPDAALSRWEDRVDLARTQPLRCRVGDHTCIAEAVDALARHDPETALVVLRKREHVVAGETPGGVEVFDRVAVQTIDALIERADPQRALTVSTQRRHGQRRTVESRQRDRRPLPIAQPLQTQARSSFSDPDPQRPIGQRDKSRDSHLAVIVRQAARPEFGAHGAVPAEEHCIAADPQIAARVLSQRLHTSKPGDAIGAAVTPRGWIADLAERRAVR